MPYDKNKTKIIAISRENYNKMRQLGHTPDSFNDVVTRLLKNAKVETESIGDND